MKAGTDEIVLRPGDVDCAFLAAPFAGVKLVSALIPAYSIDAPEIYGPVA